MRRLKFNNDGTLEFDLDGTIIIRKKTWQDSCWIELHDIKLCVAFERMLDEGHIVNPTAWSLTNSEMGSGRIGLEIAHRVMMTMEFLYRLPKGLRVGTPVPSMGLHDDEIMVIEVGTTDEGGILHFVEDHLLKAWTSAGICDIPFENAIMFIGQNLENEIARIEALEEPEDARVGVIYR